MPHSQNCAESCNDTERLCHLLFKTATARSSYFQNLSKWTLIASFLTMCVLAYLQKQGKHFELTTGCALHYLPPRFTRSSSPLVLPDTRSGRAEHRTRTRSECSLPYNVQTRLQNPFPIYKQGAGTQRHCTTAKSTLAQPKTELTTVLPSAFKYDFQSILLPRKC